MNSAFIDDMARRLSDLLAQTPVADFEKNARALLTSLFAKANLVTREEFDAQVNVLARTREKLAELESKLAALESRKD
ncbi:MAG: accessory factor UbiK family protein [Betaproteobacteria bacterium]|nr:accessory factor UbiK family protein [Betaproteobacteria bacterium]